MPHDDAEAAGEPDALHAKYADALQDLHFFTELFDNKMDDCAGILDCWARPNTPTPGDTTTLNNLTNVISECLGLLRTRQADVALAARGCFAPARADDLDHCLVAQHNSRAARAALQMCRGLQIQAGDMLHEDFCPEHDVGAYVGGSDLAPEPTVEFVAACVRRAAHSGNGVPKKGMPPKTRIFIALFVDLLSARRLPQREIPRR